MFLVSTSAYFTLLIFLLRLLLTKGDTAETTRIYVLSTQTWRWGSYVFLDKLSLTGSSGERNSKRAIFSPLADHRLGCGASQIAAADILSDSGIEGMSEPRLRTPTTTSTLYTVFLVQTLRSFYQQTRGTSGCSAERLPDRQHGCSLVQGKIPSFGKGRIKSYPRASKLYFCNFTDSGLTTTLVIVRFAGKLFSY